MCHGCWLGIGCNWDLCGLVGKFIYIFIYFDNFYILHISELEFLGDLDVGCKKNFSKGFKKFVVNCFCWKSIYQRM